MNILTVKITRAGTIPVFGDEIVFVTSLRHPGRLVLPKGKIKKWEIPLDAAKRETEEESGAIGEIDPTLAFHNDSTVYYLMNVKEIKKKFEDEDCRDVILLSFDDVENSLRIVKSIKRIMRDVKKRIQADTMSEFKFV